MPQAARKIEGQSLFRGAELRSVSKEARTAEFVFTTGHRGARYSWLGDEWFEELEVSEKAVRMDRLKAGTSPFLINHGYREEGFRLPMIKDQVGVISRAWIENGQGIIEVRFSTRPEAEPIWQDVAGGILRNCSVGYNVYKWEDVTPDDESKKIFRGVDWEPLEVSLVPIGFDPGAASRSGGQPTLIRAGQSDGAFQTEIISNRAAGDGGRQERNAMPPENKDPNTTPAPQVDEAAIRAAAAKAEKDRQVSIRAVARAAKLPDSFAEKLIADDVTVADARTAVIDELAKASSNEPETRQTVRIEAGGQDELKTRADAVVNALMHRFDPTKNQLSDAGREFRGMTLAEMGREYLSRQGVSTRGLGRSELASEILRVRAFHATGDFPNLLANVARKSLLMGFDMAVARQTFRPLVKVAYTSDFKQVTRVGVGEVPTLEKVPEGAEVTRGTIGERKEVYNLATYSRIFAITREVIINDDLGAFTNLPSKFGGAAARLESDIVWAILTGTQVMGDGNALFDATNHGNHKASGGAAPDVTGLTAARVAMRKQVGVNGKDALNIAPRFLIVPPELETAAQQLTVAVTPAQVSNVNPFQGSIVPIAEARLSATGVANGTTAWYMAADPAEGYDVLELLYLEGQTGPLVESRTGFDVNGVEVKALHDVAAKALDWRTLYKNKGA